MRSQRKEGKIIIIGGGTLGSYATLILASMGYSNIKVYDADSVEYHNFRNQLYTENDVGKSKTEALKEKIKLLTGAEIETENKFYGTEDAQNIPHDAVIISLVDSMKTREIIFESVKYNPKVRLFIDARTGGHVANVYATNPCDPDGIRRYEEELYTDEKASPVACANQTTLPTVWSVAAAIGKLMDLWVAGFPLIYEKVLINCEGESMGIAWEEFVFK